MLKSGIYQFKNIVNETIYIGSAKNLQERKNRHLRDLKKNNHHSLKFQRSYNKYGESNFIYQILLYCEIEDLIRLEQKYLDEILFANFNDERFDNIGLNINRNALNSTGQKRSDETKNKMSMIAKKRFENEDPWNKGKTGIYTKEVLEKMSLSKKGIKLNSDHAKKVILNLKPIVSHTEETKKKISLSKIGKGGTPILQFDLDENFIEEFDSIRAASKKYNVTSSCISANCRGKQKNAVGYIWRYK